MGVISVLAVAARLPDHDLLGLRFARWAHRALAGIVAAGCGRHRSGPFIGLGVFWLFVPSRIAIVAWFLVATDLEDGEHAPHFNRTIRALAGHHRQRVVGDGHFHLAHVGHPAFPHHHVVGYQVRDLLDDASVINAHHGRHVVPHGVHRVMTFVAMESPVAFFVSEKIKLPHLADRHGGGYLGPTRADWRRTAIGATDDK